MSKKFDDRNAVPDWFDAALAATRENYQRIDISKHICRLCGVTLHVATDPIDQPFGTDPVSGRTAMSIVPSVYGFCGCAQWLGHPDDRSWEELAAIYHEKIAEQDSEKHRANMLRGYPTTEFILLWRD